MPIHHTSAAPAARQKKAIIIGAGPAGLTAAFELLKRTDIIPIILEKDNVIGGISRTINYKGNRMDMGPHRFFSKSDRVMSWWLNIMPLEESTTKAASISYQNKSRELATTPGATGNDPDKVMLIIKRLTRIYFLRKFFAYPIQLSFDTLRTLGFIRTLKILLSFLRIRLFPRRPEKSLEDFIINKFGRQLYLLFFKDYTEKVWGIRPDKIPAEWGAQRIKGVSLGKAIRQALKDLRHKRDGDIGQKDEETSLIEQFLYPKHGPGALWEEVARQIREMGGQIHFNQQVQHIHIDHDRITSVNTVNEKGETATWEGDYFFSTMPVQELIAGMGDNVPGDVQKVAAGLQYRDFINVGILLKKMVTKEGKPLDLNDNWIYIQERDIKVGRLMIYNNWGGGMTNDPNTTWIGMEYFCNTTDAFWSESDETIQRTAIRELETMDLARTEDVLDITVARMGKTYPAYFGTYDQFDKIKEYTDQFANLFLIGRNGMHKYNNADHSMLCAMVAVDNIVAGVTAKTNIWSINTEQEYHEEKAADPVAGKPPTQYPFLIDYLWNNRPNRAWWLVGLAAFILQFVIFKFRYPFANYMPDSYSYLEAAASNADVNMWPVAYSKFLRLISVFTHSDKAVVGLQYLFLQGSTLLFAFSLFFWLKPGRGVKTFLLIFFIFNPVPLYVANYISADALFIGLSLLWMTTLVWLIYRPRRWLTAVHAILLLACFTVRYNAIYYPFIAILVFLLSRQPWKRKIAGIALSVALVATSFFWTSQKMKTTTGQWQFSAFGGWQLANNALYMYQKIPAAERGAIPAQYASLETMVRQHMDTLGRVKFSHDDSLNAYFYLWNGRGPLIQYLTQQFKKDSTTPYFKRWASLGPLYAGYARYLIKKFPLQFAEDWMLPNAVKFAVPPTEFLGEYNMGKDSVDKLAKDWFNYKTRKVQQRDKTKLITGIPATDWFPVFAAMANILLIMGLIGVVWLGIIKRKEYGIPQLLTAILALWLINGAFSIFASPIVLRYQFFPLLVAFLIGTVLIERIYKLAQSETKQAS